MSTTGKAAALLASVGILAAGWSVGTANGRTLVTTSATTTGTTSGTASGAGTVAAGAAPGTTASMPSTATSAATSAASVPSATASAASAPSATASAAAASGATGTFTGATQTDRWGSLTVTVTLSSGRITDVSYTSTAGDGKSRQIESRAVPTLKSEVVAANSTQVATVSGATYTSAKYLTSLQSALDKAA